VPDDRLRLRLLVEYDGGLFHGWQVQPELPTVQGTLEQALRTILGQSVRAEAAGRTDAGVHALGQVVACTVRGAPDLNKLCAGLNALCGPAIAVHRIETASLEFDPRRDAASRTYEYRIRNHPWPSPFARRYAWHVRAPLDLEAMARAAAVLVGEHDFRSFQGADCDAGHSVRRVFESRIERRGEELVYRIRATAFLRHMVRNIVGTLVEVGQGLRTVEEFGELLHLRDRRRAGPTAPAHGLYLVSVEYPPGRSEGPRPGVSLTGPSVPP
jgi:tRNA pseudouridine38-40 synthase